MCKVYQLWVGQGLIFDDSMQKIDFSPKLLIPYNPVSSRSRLIPGRQDLLSEENISFNSRPV